MEALKRFVNSTKTLAYTVVPSGFIIEWVLPAMTAFLFGVSAAIGGSPVQLKSVERFLLPAFALGFICAVWCNTDSGSDKALLLGGERERPTSRFAVFSAALGTAAGSLASGCYAGALAAALFSGAVPILRKNRGMNDIFRHTALLAVLIAALPVSILVGIYKSITLEGVLVYIACCGVTLLVSLIETRALAAARAIAKRKAVTDEMLVALSALAGFIAMSFGRVRPLGIGLGTVFAAVFSMLAVHSKGIAGVACSALVAGIRVVGCGGDIMFIAVLCSCTMLGCMLRSFGKWGVAAGFTLPAVAFLALIRGTGALRIAEIIAANIIFLSIPKRAVELIGVSGVSGRTERLEKQLLYKNYKLATLSEVLKELAGLFKSGDGPADGFINRQLTGVADSLARLSGTQREQRISRFNIDFGYASCPKKGFSEAGDSYLVRDFDGLYLAAISDGMGSGERARRESRQTVQLLADLVTCGFKLEEAAECVNRLLLLRECGEMYATLDAVMFDPMAGTMYLIKHGAPPSYVLRNGKLSTLYSEALPVGIIEDAHPAVCSVRMRRGDVIIMMSDGVADAFGHELVASLTDNAAESDPQLAAKLLVELASRRGGGADDMTALVARID